MVGKKINNSIKLLKEAKKLIPTGSQTFSKGTHSFSENYSPSHSLKGKGNKIINIPKDKLSSGEEFMAHAQVLSEDSSLRIEVGKRSVTLKPKDWSEYILSRAKRGKKVGKLINIERLIEEVKPQKEDT